MSSGLSYLGLVLQTQDAEFERSNKKDSFKLRTELRVSFTSTTFTKQVSCESHDFMQVVILTCWSAPSLPKDTKAIKQYFIMY